MVWSGCECGIICFIKSQKWLDTALQIQYNGHCVECEKPYLSYCLSFPHLNDPVSDLVLIFHDIQALHTQQKLRLPDIFTANWRSCSERVYISLHHSSFPIPFERLWQAVLLWRHAPIFLLDAGSIRNGAPSSDPELQEDRSIMVWIPCRQRRGAFQWRCSVGRQALISMQHTYTLKITHARLVTAACRAKCALEKSMRKHQCVCKTEVWSEGELIALFRYFQFYIGTFAHSFAVRLWIITDISGVFTFSFTSK